jgi:5-methylcytosine-specific restriction endonuclease McrA
MTTLFNVYVQNILNTQAVESTTANSIAKSLAMSGYRNVKVVRTTMPKVENTDYTAMDKEYDKNCWDAMRSDIREWKAKTILELRDDPSTLWDAGKNLVDPLDEICEVCDYCGKHMSTRDAISVGNGAMVCEKCMPANLFVDDRIG